MAKKITVIGGSGFVGTNLCRQLSLKQQDFEIIDLKMSNQFPEKCKIVDVRDADTLRLNGRRFDCGSVEGFMQASAHEYERRLVV